VRCRRAGAKQEVSMGYTALSQPGGGRRG
jgi:hypothetical protein